MSDQVIHTLSTRYPLFLTLWSGVQFVPSHKLPHDPASREFIDDEVLFFNQVRQEGIGPSTSVLSGQRSTTELLARLLDPPIPLPLTVDSNSNLRITHRSYWRIAY